MDARQTTILRLLLAADAPLNGKFLAERNNVTSRTTRSDIHSLNRILKQHGAEVEPVHGIGYQLRIQDDSLFREWLAGQLRDEKPVNYANPDNRVNKIIHLMFTANGYIRSEELADMMYVSKSTLQNDLKEVKKKLELYHITVEAKPHHGLRIRGDEMKIRFGMSELLFDRENIHSDSMYVNLFSFLEHDLTVIRSSVTKHVQNYGVELSDTGLNNLIIHIAIACQRIKNDHNIIELPGEHHFMEQKQEYEAAKTIVTDIEKLLSLKFPETEITYITMHLLGTKLLSAVGTDEREITRWVDKDTYQYAMDIMKAIESKLKLGISGDPELLKSLCLHLRPALNRIRYGMSLRNPMLESIQSTYPLAFQGGVIAGMVIQQKMGRHVSENEIGYLALHIGAAMERRRESYPPKRCIIVCSSGVGSARLLFHKLRIQFGVRLDIVDTVGYYKLAHTDLDNIDLIISTVPIALDISVPVINVNSLLGNSDLMRIEQAITGVSDNNMEYLQEDLTFISCDFNSREEVLHFLCDQLQHKGLVGPDFYDLVVQREEVTPTSFGNSVAIPHPILPQTEHTFWAICTLQKPVNWGSKPVQFICLLCIAKDGEAGDLTTMYDLLVRVVDDANLVQKLIKCQNYQQIHHIFRTKS
ncbi:BglG family transcription antiterminator [Paenibacillus sp. FSL R7-0128]|uniref:BglG family transcription antiterminator n=1 Tax=Paenibacillus sp. FSL R7-0128 TaxID=2954529 RepID=UPI0030F66165